MVRVAGAICPRPRRLSLRALGCTSLLTSCTQGGTNCQSAYQFTDTKEVTHLGGEPGQQLGQVPLDCLSGGGV